MRRRGSGWLGTGTALLAVAAVGMPASAAATNRSSDQLVVLTATFGGKAKAVFGSSREWYSPRSGVFRTERMAPNDQTVSVYDGHTLVHALGGRTIRTTGSGKFVPIAAREATRNILATPAIVVWKLYRLGKNDPDLTVRSVDGGRTIDAVLKIQGDNASRPAYIPIRVVQTGTVSASEGLLRLPRGRAAGEVHQAKPGAKPTFGERGYWFGPSLGRARAATALENWGTSILEAASLPGLPGPEAMRKNAHYTTMYRLPLADVAGLPAPASPFPGLGDQGPRDIRVDCGPAIEGFLSGLQPNTPGMGLALADGERAKLYLSPYSQGSLGGVTADIVVGRTECFIRGLVSAPELRRVARTLRPA